MNTPQDKIDEHMLGLRGLVQELFAAEITAATERGRQAGLIEAAVSMAATVKARDPAETDQIALDYATRIENLFANGWDGVKQRRNAVKCVIREVIDIVLLGAKHEAI